MAEWTTFGASAVVLTAGFVVLARSTAGAVRDALAAPREPGAPPHPVLAAFESDRLLVANLLGSHGVLLVLLAGTVWWTGVPPSAIGATVPTPGDVGLGLAVGLVLAAGNEAAARAAAAVGLERDERLRELLAPDTRSGWALLLAVVLPLVAVTEELLFRGVLVGGLATGYGFDPWGLAVASSAAFGAGHGLQGRAGVVVTAALGLALAAAFLVTGSLAVAVVAHYVVNAAEFLVHEPPPGWR